VNFARRTQHFYSLLDSLNLCQFACGPSWQLYGPEEIVKILQAVTGWDVTIEELLAVGERRLNMMRTFNSREGINRNQDVLPEKLFQKGLKGGPSDGWKVDRAEWEVARDEYYRQSGWDVKLGIPTRGTLERLGLGWVADKIGS
jgi:aldehyde:ferredoxin oxidoreductase